MTTRNLPRLGVDRRRQTGLSLVELLVALTVGLFLLGAIGSIYVSTSQSTRGSTQESQMNEDAALALEVLAQQIRLAGFSGFQAPPDSDVRNFQGRALFGCDAGFSNVDNTNNEPNFDLLACAGGAGSSSIAVRFEATTLNTSPVAAAGGGTNPSNCSYFGIAPWSLAGGPNIALAENRFFIAPDPQNNNVPSLRCRGRTGAGFGAVTTLIPNIEDLQITFAVTRLPPVAVGEVLPHQITAYLTAAELNDVAIGGLNGWQRVAGARICLVARSTERFAGLPVALRQYVDCQGNQVTAPDDGLIRRSYVTTVMARNLRPGVPDLFAAGGNPWTLLNGDAE